MTLPPLADFLRESSRAVEETLASASAGRVDQAVSAIITGLKEGKPVLVCGNGGSASDAMHITGELVGRFLKDRRALNCICLVSNPAVLTAWANDHSYDTVFSRQVEAYGQDGGVLIGLSTSGNSANIVRAFETARELRLTTIALTGAGGGRLSRLSDILIDVPSQRTPIIQQIHICIYHYICECVEAALAA
jgi:D-sedoheptulose 7-phosphate isomerase